MPEQHEDVTVVDGKRQWSVPLSIAFGAIALISFWPTPDERLSVVAFEESTTTLATRPIVGSESADIEVKGESSAESVVGASGGSVKTQDDEEIVLPLDLLLLEDPSISAAGGEQSEVAEVPAGESTSEQNDGDVQPSDPGESSPVQLVDEPTGADVLQVVRWVGGAVAVSTPAEANISADVSQVVRLAWAAQRQAVSEGVGSAAWDSALAYRTGFARVLLENLMTSIQPSGNATISESAFTVIDVRTDAVGRAIASICLVEDAGFGSFADSQGQWGSVVVVSVSIGLVRSAGGWTVDDVARAALGTQC